MQEIRDIASDLRYTARTLSKSPGFFTAAVACLALGIGASTAVFSLVNAILLKPLPYPNPEAIVVPKKLPPSWLTFGFDEYPWGRWEFLEASKGLRTFRNLAAFKSDSFNLTGTGEPVRLEGLRASAALLPALGVSPILGRTFTPDEDRPGREYEVVLGNAVWRDYFGRDPAILGRTVRLNGYDYTVVGIMPAGFSFPHANEMSGVYNFPREAQLWVPIALAPGPAVPAEPSELAVIGRLSSGVSLDQAQAELNLLTKTFEREFPKAKAAGWFNFRATRLARHIVGDLQRPLLLLLAAVGVVLLIASSNVASLLLTRSIGRSREFTVRAALGASAHRLLRQLLTESLVLASIGGAAGMLIAQAGINFLKAFGPSTIPRLNEAALDTRVLLFAIGITCLTGILFGLAPATAASRGNLADSLRGRGSNHQSGPSASGFRKALLVSQIALAMILVVAATLLTRSLVSMAAVVPGFDAEHVLTMELTLPASKYADNDRIVAFYRQLIERLRSLPAVAAAGITDAVPMGGSPDSTGIRILDHPLQDPKARPYADYAIASPGYFDATGTRILHGRDFLDSDNVASQPVVIISRAMAAKFWPGIDPLGKQMGLGSPKYPPMTIIGIVPDVRRGSLRDNPGPCMYVLYSQKPYPSMLTMQVALRTRQDPLSATASVRSSILGLDPALPVAKISALTTLVDRSLAPQRFSSFLLLAFGALALLLASIGMYGLISYTVAQRTQEIGIRMALGAGQGTVFRMVLGQGARLAAAGIGLGIIAALGVTRLMASFLFGVAATDLKTFVFVAGVLTSVALLACYFPARRATQVDPAIAFRCD